MNFLGREPDRKEKGLHSSGADMERKFWVALVLYTVLAAVAWFTLGEGTVLVGGRLVELRVLPVIILGGLALRTVLARQAEKIRRDGDKGGS
jgi:hypothetical protein